MTPPVRTPQFLTLQDDRPRTSSLLQGVVGAVIVFAALAFGFSRGAGAPVRSKAAPTASTTAYTPQAAAPAEQAHDDDDAIPEPEPLVATPNTAVIPALVAQFRKVDVVALGERPNTAEDSMLRIGIIRHRVFPRRVQTVVVEFCNSRYQDVLDRFIAGEEMSDTEYQRAWRDALQPGPISTVYDQFLHDIRTVNRKLPPGRKIRVLAAGPPIDWWKITSHEQVKPFLDQADSFPAELIAKEVLGKGKKALVVVNASRLWRNTLGILTPDDATLVARLDKEFPGRFFTVVRLGGPYKGTRTLHKLIAGAPPPVAFPLTGTVFGKLDANAFIGRDLPVHFFPEGLTMESVADACVYTGSRPDTIVNSDPDHPLDLSYSVEWERRRRLLKPSGSGAHLQ